MRPPVAVRRRPMAYSLPADMPERIRRAAEAGGYRSASHWVEVVLERHLAGAAPAASTSLAGRRARPRPLATATTSTQKSAPQPAPADAAGDPGWQNYTGP